MYIQMVAFFSASLVSQFFLIISSPIATLKCSKQNIFFAHKIKVNFRIKSNNVIRIYVENVNSIFKYSLTLILAAHYTIGK